MIQGNDRGHRSRHILRIRHLLSEHVRWHPSRKRYPQDVVRALEASVTIVIGAFPDPYPDELLYSVQARYQERLGDWHGCHTSQEFFGSPHVIASTLFSSHLSTLVARLPRQALSLENQDELRHTARDLLTAHTLLPYYAPFLPPERLARVEEDLLHAGGPTVQTRMGIMASAVSAPRWLRYCPVCAQEDRTRFGEPYWRREQQAPGLLICVRHGVWLERSCIRARGRDARRQYISASQALKGIAAPRRVRGSCERDVLMALAYATHELLTREVHPFGLQTLHTVYLSALLAQGLASPRGRIQVSTLTEAFLARYPEPLLRLLRCQLRGRIEGHHHWLARLARRPRYAQHPLHHLLLQHFLGLQVEEVVALCGVTCATQPHAQQSGTPDMTTATAVIERMMLVVETPFGSGPWPCLNPTCGQFQLPRIVSCRVSYPASAHGRPLGTFSCSCGFVYKRLGPDMTTADRFRRGAICAYGEVWARQLRERWERSADSVNAIASALGVDPLTIKRQAHRLGLPLDRTHVRRSRPLRLSKPLKGRPTYVVSKQERTQRRSAWQALMKAYPNLPARQLRLQDNALYTWLYRHDRDWFHQHLSQQATSRQPPARVNWPQRDHDLAREIDRILPTLRQERTSDSTRLVRITLTLIGRRIGRLALLHQHLDALPETAQHLAVACESWEAFAVRRVRWTAAAYHAEHLIPRRWEFIRRAGIDRHMKQPHHAGIAAEVDRALYQLEHSCQHASTSPEGTGFDENQRETWVLV